MDSRTFLLVSKRLALGPSGQCNARAGHRRTYGFTASSCAHPVIVLNHGSSNQTRHQSGSYRPFGNPREPDNRNFTPRNSDSPSFRPRPSRGADNGRWGPDTPPRNHQRPPKPTELSPILMKALNADPSRPANFAIKASNVTFVNDQGQTLLEQSLQQLVQSTNPLTHVVRQVDIQRGIPIVKIVAVKDVIAETQEKKKKTNKKPSEKQLELNWAIDPHDLGHKCKLMKEFLSQGRRVEILLAPKRKGRRASPEDMTACLDTLKAAVEDVPGAKEVKPMEGKVGGMCKLFFDNAVPVKESEPVEEGQEGTEETDPGQMSKYERKQHEKEERKRKQEEKLRAGEERAKARLEQAKADGVPVVEGL